MAVVGELGWMDGWMDGWLGTGHYLNGEKTRLINLHVPEKKQNKSPKTLTRPSITSKYSAVQEKESHFISSSLTNTLSI